MDSIDYPHLTVMTLTNTIPDLRGVRLPKGASILMLKKIREKEINEESETCLVYLDTGGNSLSDFNQYIINKKILYENSIRHPD
jgi:hypothetical protein